jgi:peptidyl-prolyl cis-trans isomerase D
MAVIFIIRKHSTILLIAVAVALIAFLLGDFLSNPNQGGDPRRPDKLIVVGGENISWNDFNLTYDMKKQQEKDNRGVALQGEQEFQLGNQLYNELVDSLLINKQASSLGIVVTNEEVADLIASDMPHPWAQQWFNIGDGYKVETVRNFLSNLGSQDSNIVKYYFMQEAALAKEAFYLKYLNLLSKAYYLPKAFAKRMADEQQTKAELEVVQIPYSSELVSDDKISFTQDDVKKWYEENKYRFEQEEELRDVDYVIFEIQPSSVDLDNIAKSVSSAYDEFLETDQPELFINRMSDTRYDSTYFKQGALPVPALDTIVFNAPVGTFIPPFIDGNNWIFAKLLNAKDRPDTISASYIVVLKHNQERQVRTTEEATARLDSAYHLLKSGADFYQTALQFSDDNVAQMPDSGNLWLVDGSGMPVYQAWFDTLYKLPVGSIVKYNLPGADFIFKTNQHSPFTRKVQLAIAKKAIDASSETIDNIESIANNFANGLTNSKDFEEKVAKEGLNKRNFNRVQIMSYSLPGVNGNGRELIRWVYDDKKVKKGDVSSVFLMENMFVVLTLKEIFPKGYTSLSNEQLKSYAESMVKRDKKAEKLEELLRPSLSKNLTDIATQFTVIVDTVQVAFGDRNFGRYGPEAKILGEIFAKQANQNQTIYKGDMGVYVLKVNKIDIPDMAFNEQNHAAIDLITEQGKRTFAQNVQNAALKVLQKMYKIEDNRYKFF